MAGILVETYEIEEPVVAEDGNVRTEQELEAIKMIEEFGLAGQKKLVKTVDRKDGPRDERVPYERMSASEAATYKAVFHVTEKVQDYDCGPIPVRVLQVYGHARGLFESVEVWHDNVKNPDPLLVGVNKEGTHKTTVYHLLARWGTALKPFAEIASEARMKLKMQYTKECNDLISQSQAFLAQIDKKIDRALEGGWVSVPH